MIQLKTLSRYFQLLLLIFFLPSCLSLHSKIESSIKFNEPFTLEKLFVLTKIYESDYQHYLNGFHQGIELALDRRNIEVEIHNITGYELDKNKHKKKIHDFQPKYLLILSTLSAKNTKRELLAELYQAQNKSKVWSAKLVLFLRKKSFFISEDTAEKSGIQDSAILIKKLYDDTQP